MVKNPGLIHLLVALVWLFLSGNSTTGSFLVALVGTYFLLSLFKKAIGCESYVRRVRAFFIFLGKLFVEIVLANLYIMKVAIMPKAGFVEGGFLYYDVSELTNFETLLVACCIGLSPGTMVADKSEDKKTLIVHIFPANDPEKVRETIDRTLKHNIMAFTR